MLRPIRVHVDASVSGGTQDDEFREPSRRFSRAVARGDDLLPVSEPACAELIPAPAAVQAVLDAIDPAGSEYVPQNAEADALGRAYVDGGASRESSFEDAAHVATVPVAGADLILSWNFRHVVNDRRIRQSSAINIPQGCKPLDVRSPLKPDDD